jgi:hypothetical protein
VDWKATAHTGDLQVREFAREQEQAVEIYLDRCVPPAHKEWFERAVSCCAFLSWRLSQQGTAIHFRSQGFDVRLPEEGDVYTILKYLALVPAQVSESVQEKTADGPANENSYPIVLTARPRPFKEGGWTAARVVGPDALSPVDASAAASEPDRKA